MYMRSKRINEMSRKFSFFMDKEEKNDVENKTDLFI